jgi:osmotically-inducible protein OsmY
MLLQDRTGMLTGLGLGIGLMHFLDPDQGRRRGALVRDQMAHASRLVGDATSATGRDIAHRISGTAAEFQGALGDTPISDHVLVERVRARLGRAVSHPHAVDVLVAGGVVTLRGPILQHEVNGLLKTVNRVAGVRRVVNELDSHEEPGNIPALQGAGAPERQRSFLQRNWSPTARVIAASGALALAGYGISRRG